MEFKNFLFITLSILTLNSLQYQIQAAAGAGTEIIPSTNNQQKNLAISEAFSFLNFNAPKMARTAGALIGLEPTVLFHEGPIEEVRAYQSHLTEDPNDYLKVIQYLNERGGQLALLKSQNPNYPIPALRFPMTLTDQELIDAVNVMNDTCKQLITTINLYSRSDITDAAIIALAQSCPNLQSLNLFHCYRISAAAIIALAQLCQNLQSLNLDGCPRITDAAITVLAQSCPNLQSLNLNDCPRITDAAIIALAQSCPNLQALSLSGCSSITDAAIKTLYRSFKNLQFLDVSYCPGTTHPAIHVLKTLRSNVKIIK